MMCRIAFENARGKWPAVGGPTNRIGGGIRVQRVRTASLGRAPMASAVERVLHASQPRPVSGFADQASWAPSMG